MKRKKKQTQAERKHAKFLEKFGLDPKRPKKFKELRGTPFPDLKNSSCDKEGDFISFHSRS